MVIYHDYDGISTSISPYIFYKRKKFYYHVIFKSLYFRQVTAETLGLT